MADEIDATHCAWPSIRLELFRKSYSRSPAAAVPAGAHRRAAEADVLESGPESSRAPNRGRGPCGPHDLGRRGERAVAGPDASGGQPAADAPESEPLSDVRVSPRPPCREDGRGREFVDAPSHDVATGYRKSNGGGAVPRRSRGRRGQHLPDVVVSGGAVQSNVRRRVGAGRDRRLRAPGRGRRGVRSVAARIHRYRDAPRGATEGGPRGAGPGGMAVRPLRPPDPLRL